MKTPVIHPSAFIAPNATVLGDITVGENSSFFFGAVARSEYAPIVIGANTNIQDNCVLHSDVGLPTTVGDGVTVGHGAILHSCTVGDNTIVGMGSVVLNGAVIGEDCIVATGAVVPQYMVIPPRSLVMGCPAKVRRSVTDEEVVANRRSAEGYVKKAAEYKELLKTV